jgi:hypothetical protein
MTVPRLQVFCSHINTESLVADFLHERIRQDFLGLVEVINFSNTFNTLAGQNWLEQLTESLKKSDLHLVLCSFEALTRSWVNFEAGAARVRGIPIVPLCYMSLTPAQLPIPFAMYEGLGITTPTGWEKLYGTISDKLGTSVPSVGFTDYASKITQLEAAFRNQKATLAKFGGVPSTDVAPEIVENPNVLCISSPQFMEIGFKNQLQAVIDAFPSTVRHARVLDSRSLIREVRQNKYQVVHLATYVCPRSGDVYFSDVDLQNGAAARLPADKITADALASLLQESGTQLVVITSCDSSKLLLSLIETAHIVATRDMVSANMMAQWVQDFYARLTDAVPLSQALEYATNNSGAPMGFYARQPRSMDVKLQINPEPAAQLVSP